MQARSGTRTEGRSRKRWWFTMDPVATGSRAPADIPVPRLLVPARRAEADPTQTPEPRRYHQRLAGMPRNPLRMVRRHHRTEPPRTLATLGWFQRHRSQSRQRRLHMQVWMQRQSAPAGGGAAAAGSLIHCDASLGRIFRADETHGSPRALRQFARAHNSLASPLRLAPPSRTALSNHERVSAQNCRKNCNHVSSAARGCRGRRRWKAGAVPGAAARL